MAETMVHAYTDHADYYRRGPYSQFLLEHRSAGSAPIGLISVSQPAGEYPDPAFPNLLLYLAKRGTREARFDWGAGRWRGRWRTNDLTLVPPDSASDVSLSENHEFLGLCIPKSALRVLAPSPDDDPLSALLPLFEQPFRDDFTLRLVEQAWLEARQGNPHGSLFADGVAMTLLARLGSIARAPLAQNKVHPLPRYRLERVADYVDAHLNADISVADLANVAGLSMSYFSRQFRAATGMSPYGYVLERRLDRARSLLMSGQDIASVAFGLGFASQSHFTTQFRRRFGITPAKAVSDHWPLAKQFHDR